MLIAAAIIAAVIAALVLTATFWVNWWWFGSVGYRSVLLRRYAAVGTAFTLAALLAGGIFLLNIAIALRRSRRALPERGRAATIADRVVVALTAVATIAVALIAGLSAAGRWELWWLWWEGRGYGLEDPVFNRDISFYLFALPALSALADALIILLVVSAAGVVVVYTLRLGINVRDIRSVPALMRVHVLVLAGLLLLVIAGLHVLQNYELVYSDRGAVFGASYTDVNVQRIANWLLAATALAIGGLLVLNAFVSRVRVLIGAVAVWGALWVILGLLVPTAVQQTLVEPSELSRERPYIANNIAMTRVAFGLDAVETRDLSGQDPVTAEALAGYPVTVDNVRLWDYRVIRGTYQQLQSFVPYYVFLDVDVDRYLVDGAIQQVLVSAREFDGEGLPDNAQTWTNRRLVYTHGHGAVISPVSAVSPQGLPRLLVERIPPTGEGVYRIDRPEIYFGEADLGWVAVNTDQPEFSGLIDDNGSASTGYAGAGKGSIKLDDYLSKLLLAIELRDRNLLLSGTLTSESRVLLRRNVVDRIDRIAPFLRLDPDPYLVIADGRLVWVVDAYTASDRFPHATRTNGVNYVRNSVKVVVDAYDGTVTFYRTAEPDPIADAYARIYDGLLRPIAEAPPSIAAHFRYPEQLYEIQSAVHATVHVGDPSAFYNGEDRWAIPQEQVDGDVQQMVPYFVTMTLPGEANPEFTLIRPFIPGGRSNRQNMTAWMAGRIGADGRLSLVVYRFPRQETVFGPRQMEARIDQEPEISAQITLWNQSGSRVIRGNLLVIPIGQSVLYVQPLYLQAAATEGALPELKRVIVASNRQVVMAETFDAALARLSGQPAPPSPAGEAQAPTDVGTVLDDPTVRAALDNAISAYERGEQALAAGDWSGYGSAQGDLEAALAELDRLTGGEAPVGVATPVASPVPEQPGS